MPTKPLDKYYKIVYKQIMVVRKFFFMSETLHTALKVEAAKRGMKLTQLVNQALTEFLEKLEGEVRTNKTAS